MKNIILSFSFLLMALVCKSQVTFQKTFGGADWDWAYAVQQTSDEGYVVAGRTWSFGTGSEDVSLIRTDSNGDTLWTKNFGGTAGDYAHSVQQTTDGGFIVAGITYSFGAGSGDVYLIKTNVNGDTLWTKTFGGTNNDYAKSVKQTTDGGYVITGLTLSFGAGSADVYLIRTDANGNLLWSKTFGGADDDGGYAIEQTTDGGYIISGYNFKVIANGYNAYLVKTNALGDSLWTRAYGGASADARSVQQTYDGGYILTGKTHSFGAGVLDVYLVKTDAAGDTLWSKTFGGVDSDYGESVKQTSDGGFIIAGYTLSFSAGVGGIYLIRTDGNGNLLWTKEFGGPNDDAGFALEQTADGGYIIAGMTMSYGAGGVDEYLIKTDSLGNSGCNQAGTSTIVTTPATVITIPAAISTSPATMETKPATLTCSECIVHTVCTTVGVNESGADNLFLVSPNPSTGNFVISTKTSLLKGEIEILNIVGENIWTGNIFNEAKKEIKIDNISNGIYFVRLTENDRSYYQKLIVEHN